MRNTLPSAHCPSARSAAAVVSHVVLTGVCRAHAPVAPHPMRALRAHVNVSGLLLVAPGAAVAVCASLGSQLFQARAMGGPALRVPSAEAPILMAKCREHARRN